jgi:hypothetical protein
MTIQVLKTKLKKRAWIIILGTLVIGSIGFVQTGKNVSFVTTDTLSITLKNYQNNPNDSEIRQIGSDEAYVGAVNFAGLFLSSQLKSLPIQLIVAEKSAIKIGANIEKKSVYSVEDVSGGYSVITNRFDSKEKAQKFQVELKKVAKEEVEKSYNLNRNLKFAGEVNFGSSSIIEIKTPFETQILPTIAGFILLFAICSIAPLKKN